MKDLLKIYRRYILTAASISIIIILMNLALYIAILYEHTNLKGSSNLSSRRVQEMADSLIPAGDSYTFPEESGKIIDTDYAFAMLINQQGDVVWSRNLPDDIPRSYSLTEVASFTRWYLEDYPVKVWEHPDGLFVAAAPQGSRWKHGIEYNTTFITSIPTYFLTMLICNLVLIFLLALLFGHRFYAALKPLARGIENLSSQEAFRLPERGIVSGLARKLNRASNTLIHQKQALEKRDNARTNWIAGVSHDIRTPLSLITGYADTLEQSPNLNPEEKRAAASIKTSSLQIKQLIADLNLTSKLEFDSYPLRVKNYVPAALLRTLAAHYLNNQLTDSHPMELETDPRLESISLTGDAELLLRAFRNLVDNSIRHNPQGCSISVQAGLSQNHVHIHFSDTGTGIPVGVIQSLYRLDEQPEEKGAPHIMGLRIVRQIVEIHQGQLEFQLQKNTCHKISISLPLPAEAES